MRKFVPKRTELAIFAALALLSALLVEQLAESSDLVAAVFAWPIFIVAAVLGLRRSPLWTANPQAPSESDDQDPEAA